jgi:hypothetical protein
MKYEVSHSTGQIKHCFPGKECFLMVVFNFNVDDMNRSIEISASVQ